MLLFRVFKTEEAQKEEEASPVMILTVLIKTSIEHKEKNLNLS